MPQRPEVRSPRDECVEQQGSIRRGAGQRASHDQPGGSPVLSRPGQPAARFEAHQPARRGGNADGAPAVGSRREGQQPGGDCGGTAARGSAGAAAQRVRVAGRRSDPVLAVGRQSEFRDLRLAQRDDAGVLERGGQGAVGRGRLVLQGGASVRGDDAGDVGQVLEGRRHAVQRRQGRVAVVAATEWRLSAAAASLRACSAVTVMNAPRCGFSLAMRSRKCAAAWRAESSPERRHPGARRRTVRESQPRGSFALSRSVTCRVIGDASNRWRYAGSKRGSSGKDDHERH